jgi:NDP-sugar pyrophosphorylase family protein
VTAAPRLDGAIIAAGSGSRLRQAGWSLPKPLVPVAGVPLIEHAIGHFVAASVTSLAIIVNEDGADAVGWVRRRFPGLDLRFVVKTTDSSLESFREVIAGSDAEQTLVSTVDAWCPDAEFVRFVRAAQEHGADATVLGVTPLVADERPLWAHLDADGRVRRLGGGPAALVTAGFYLVPRHVTRMAIPPGLGRLREFLAWLVERGEPVFGVVVPAVVDVDRADDVALAEALARPPVRR